MESRFDKYSKDSNHTNINSYIDFNFNKGLDIIETEIKALKDQIAAGNKHQIFSNKIELLIKLGKLIENIHETYHFKRDN